jgi:hypothetical protein
MKKKPLPAHRDQSLHDVRRNRKGGAHVPKSKKRAKDKLRRELEDT